MFLFYVIRFHFLIINVKVKFFSSPDDGTHKITIKKRYVLEFPETKYMYKIHKFFFFPNNVLQACSIYIS